MRRELTGVRRWWTDRNRWQSDVEMMYMCMLMDSLLCLLHLKHLLCQAHCWIGL
jgi:hypothetical protein